MEKLAKATQGKALLKGIYFALAAATISGFSIYINKYAVMQMGDPFVFTTTKNVAVALLLLALFILPRAVPELRRLSRRDWLALVVLGGIGGSIPFLLFFQGLSGATAASAAFIHKTLFVWVAVLAVLFLGERLGKTHLAALGLLVVGNLVLLGWPKSWALSQAEGMVLAATLLWAIEAVVAKKVMARVSPHVAAFGRMFFGAIVMLGYLAFTHRLGLLAGLGLSQVGWMAITAVFLLGYVTTYYAGLKYAPASLVASVLVLGSVITSFLYAVLDAKRYAVGEMAGLFLVAVAVLILCATAGGVRVRKLEPEVVRR